MGSCSKATKVLAAVLLVILVLVLAALCAALAAATPDRVLGGGGGWWDADLAPGVRRAVRTYAQRKIVPRLKGRDKGPFSRALRAALRDGPKGAAIARLKPYLQRSELAGLGAGRGEAGRADMRAREVLELLPPDAAGPYLDLGCGDGAITTVVGKKLDTRPTCVEVGPRPAGFPRRVRRVDASKFACLPDGRFGVVTALMSLHHLDDPDGTIAELARVTRPGGVLIIREHSLDDCPREITTPEDARLYLDWIHILYDLAEGLDPEAFSRSRYHTPGEWSALLGKAGFAAVGRARPANNRVCSYYATYLRE